MNIEIQSPEMFATAALSTIRNLANKVYGVETVLPLTTLQSWHRAESKIFWTAWEGKKIVGYIGIIPLAESSFEKTLDHFFEEKNITAQDIKPYNLVDGNFLYLFSIVVDPDYQGKEISRQLRIRVMQDLIRMIEIGYSPIKISAEALNSKGASMVKSLGMQFLQKTAKKTEIYHGSLDKASLKLMIKELSAKTG